MLTEHFKEIEFTNSDTAKKYGIDNTIPDKYARNLKNLATTLEEIRKSWGGPIKINSGYRCPELNKKIGGASNSDHVYAAAADITVGNAEKNKDLFNLIVHLAKERKITTRQIIDEYGYKWVHVSVNHKYNGWKDNQILHIC